MTSTAASPPRRRQHFAPWASQQLLCDVVGWWAAFFLLGAPALPVHRAMATFLFALIVSVTWPMPLLDWCALLCASFRAERLGQPQLTSVVDFFIASPKHSGEAVLLCPETKETSSLSHGTGSSVTAGVVSCVDSCSSRPARVNSSRGSSSGTRCFVLSAVVLLGSLVGQLDWQVPYQVWPYPSLLAYVVARGVFFVADLTRNA